MRPKSSQSSKAKVTFNGHSNSRVVGFPQVIWEGTSGDFNVIVMGMVGPDLTELFDFCEQKFSLYTVVSLWMQMLQRF
jgi:hypothetical protein